MGASDRVCLTVKGAGGGPVKIRAGSGRGRHRSRGQVLWAQSVVSRSVSPLDAAVVTIQDHQGDKGTTSLTGVEMEDPVRTLREEVQAAMPDLIERAAEGIMILRGSCEVRYVKGYPLW